jgi:transposase
MRFIGIDIGSDKHFFAVVDGEGKVLRKPTPFLENDAGYTKLRDALGSADGCLVAMEATGHYWQNHFAMLTALGFPIALLNPLRTRRFTCAERRRTRSTLWASHVSLSRSVPRRRPYPTKRRRIFASSSAAKIDLCRTSAIACDSCTASSISVSPSFLGM